MDKSSRYLEYFESLDDTLPLGERYSLVVKKFSNLDSVDGLRSTIHKARKRRRIQRGIQNIEEATRPQELDIPSYKAQLKIIQESQEYFTEIQEELKEHQLVKAMFISDVHIPYHDPDALSLIAQLLDVFKPDIANSMSDLFDFPAMSRWKDTRNKSARLWSDDIAKPMEAFDKFHDLVSSASKKTKWLSLIGNHDIRLFNYLREKDDPFSEIQVKHFMEHIKRRGILQFSNGTQNIIKLSPGLKWIHGASASKNQSTTAKNNLEKCAGKNYDEDAGIFYNVWYGHDHRRVVYPYNGITAWGSGTAALPTPHYLDHPPEWQQGIIMGVYNPIGREVFAESIAFKPCRGRLSAFWNGKLFLA